MSSEQSSGEASSADKIVVTKLFKGESIAAIVTKYFYKVAFLLWDQVQLAGMFFNNFGVCIVLFC